MNTIVDIDRPETYLAIVDQAMRSALSAKNYQRIGREQPEYIDDSASILANYGDLSEIYKSVNDAFHGRRIILSHATRLDADALAQVESVGLQPLGETNRIEKLETRIADYADQNLGSAVAPYLSGASEGTRKLIAEALMSNNPSLVLGAAETAQAGSQASRARLAAMLRAALRQPVVEAAR